MKHTAIALLLAFLVLPVSYGGSGSGEAHSSLLGARSWDGGQVLQGEQVSHDFAVRVPKGRSVRIQSIRPT